MVLIEILTAYVLVIGLLVGSFLNVCIYRIPAKKSVITPTSHCPHCAHSIRPWENIPVLSWIWLRGRCSHCREPIALRYPMVELLTGLLSVFLAWHTGIHWILIPQLLLTWALIALSFIDLDTMTLPDVITKPWAALGLFFNSLGLFLSGWSLTTPLEAWLGLVGAYATLWLISRGYQLLTGKIGIGNGDIKMLAMVGAWLGIYGSLATLYMAALLGGFFGILLIFLQGRQRHHAIPFGPFLGMAAFVTMVWPNLLANLVHFF